MHLSECSASIGSRRIVDFKRHCSSIGKEEAGAKANPNEGCDRGGDSPSGFSRSREL